MSSFLPEPERGRRRRILYAVLIVICVLLVLQTRASLTPPRRTESAESATPDDSAFLVRQALSLDSLGAWRVTAGKSEMDDSPDVTAMLDASDMIEGWLKTFRPSLVLRCSEAKTFLYVVTGMSAQPEYGKFEMAGVRYRIDQAGAVSDDWHESTDSKALFAPEPISLARRLAKAKQLIFEFTPYNSSPVTAHFELQGASSAVGRVSKTCSWSVAGSSAGRSAPSNDESSSHSAAEEEVDEPAYHDGEVDTPAKRVDALSIPYPVRSGAPNIPGDADMTFVVNSHGRVEGSGAMAIRATEERFEKAVKATLPRMRFSPAMRHGYPVRQWVRMTFHFDPPK